MRNFVSVCIATYNGELYIYEQIESILCQLSKDDEIVISDDGSIDNTLAIINAMNDSRIKLVHNLGDKGYTGNFENALKYARGKYIFLADQDDIWLPNKIEISLFYLKKYDFVVSDAVVVNKDKNVLNTSFFSIKKRYKNFLGNIYRFSYLGCCMCFRRDILEKIMPFPKRHRLCTHDNWIFLIASFFYKIKIVSTPLILYRRHGNNTSVGGEKYFVKNTLYFMIKYRLYLLICVFFRIKIIRKKNI